MTMQLQVQAEPFEAYSEESAEIESEGKFRSQRGSSGSSYGRRSSSGSIPELGRSGMWCKQA